MIATDSGWVVAGGTFEEGVAWRSPDAVTWEPVAVSDAGLLYDVHEVDGKLVAVGRSGAAAGAFVSDDGGASWQRTSRGCGSPV